MTNLRQQILSMALAYAPLLLYVAVVATFARLSPTFFTLDTFVNILVQSSVVAILAMGITFVLLTAGIDLSVGSVMYLAGTAGGSLVFLFGWPVPIALAVMLATGLLCGTINALFIARLRMTPFIVTLAMLFIARGTGLWITETRAMNLPDTFRQLATASVVGVPVPVLILAVVFVAGHLTLTRTPFGRQLYALGNDMAAAQKAGLRVGRMLAWVYIICGGCAAVGGMIELAQLSAVSPELGRGRELEAIAAAVLGGTSLFGGRGSVTGSVLGAVLIQTIYSGLNTIDADPYVYPLITSSIIFVAVLLDSMRNVRLAKLRRRKIRTGTTKAQPPVAEASGNG